LHTYVYILVGTNICICTVKYSTTYTQSSTKCVTIQTTVNEVNYTLHRLVYVSPISSHVFTDKLYSHQYIHNRVTLMGQLKTYQLLAYSLHVVMVTTAFDTLY